MAFQLMIQNARQQILKSEYILFSTTAKQSQYRNNKVGDTSTFAHHNDSTLP